MAWIQKATPPPNRVMTFELNNFIGGLNNRSEQLSPNQATSVLNMMFTDDTLMEKRYGQKHYEPTVEGGGGSFILPSLDSGIVFLDEYKPYNDEDMLVRATASSLYVNQYNVMSLLGTPSGVNHNGKYFFADGSKLYVYGKFAQTGDTFTRITGTPINNYCVLQVVSPSDGYTKLDTTYTQGVLSVDYTNMKICYEPCQNEFVDSFNGANVVPSNVKYIASYNGRLYMSGADKDNDNVYITQVQNPFYFPASMPLQVPPNSDKVVGLYVYDDSVIVARYNDLHAITGNTNNPDLGVDVFRLRKINSHTGFASSNSANIVHNYLFFLGSDGNAYALSTTKGDSKTLVTTILNTTVDIFKSPIDLTQNDLYNASSAFVKDEWLISIKDKVLVYSYRQKAWTIYDNLKASCFYNKSNTLLWGRPDGTVGMFDEDNFLDYGTPYEAHWHSKIFDMDNVSSYKQFREFYIVAHTFAECLSDVNVVFEIDYIDVKDTLTVSNQMSVWGRAKWGDRFITRNIVESLPFVLGRRGRTLRFKISNGHSVFADVDTYNDLDTVVGRTEGSIVHTLDTNKYYLLTNNAWVEQTNEMMNQRMKVYQVNGEFELRGKR